MTQITNTLDIMDLTARVEELEEENERLRKGLEGARVMVTKLGGILEKVGHSCVLIDGVLKTIEQGADLNLDQLRDQMEQVKV